jgi:hypothetical protein
MLRGHLWGFPYSVRVLIPRGKLRTSVGSLLKMASYLNASVSLQELKEKKKDVVSVDDRVIALFYVNHEVYAMDYFCYRELQKLIY